MIHDSYREFIQRELDGDLSDEEIAQLERHTASCAECRQERQEYQQLALGLMSMKALKPERSFVSQMEFDFDELLRPQAQPTPLQKKGLRRIPTGWWQGLSVAAAVVLAIGFTYNLLPGGTITQTAEPSNSVQTPAPVVALTGDTPVAQPDPAGKSVEAPQANAPVGTKPSLEPQGGSSSASNGVQQPSGGTNPSTVITQPPVVADASAGGGSDISSGTSSAGTSSGSASGTVSGTGTAGAGPVTSKPSEKPTAGGSLHGSGTIASIGPSQEHGQGIASLKDRDRFYGQTAGALAAEQPPLPMIVGTIDRPPSDLNEELQDQVRSGNTAVRWSTIPTQVVQHTLTALGFASIASVNETSHPDRVDVVQGGQNYRVRLVQPYDSGVNGIWQPVQISRELSMTSPEPTDKPILDYFNQTAQEGEFTIVSLYVEENLFMNRTVVGAELMIHTSTGPVQVYVPYTFRLKLNSDYSWSLDGKPTVRH